MIDHDEVQSTILRPMQQTTVRICFVRIDSRTEMREFLGAAAETVTTAAIASLRRAGAHRRMALEAQPQELPEDRWAVNVGVTADGLRLAGIDERVPDALSPTFTAGMRAAATRLGDDPDDWQAPFDDDDPVQAVVLDYGDAPLGALDPFVKRAPRWSGRRGPGHREPFGFRDGISDPVIEGSGKPVGGGNGVWDPETERWRAVRTGEAVLGYVDESGAVAGHPDAAHVERNGSYLVIRKLEQDVEAFEAECGQWGAELGIPGEAVAAKLVGRTRDGVVLGAAPGDDSNGFLYPDTEVGRQVPPSAHIRRATPRDSVAFADEIVPHHLIFRRGYPYEQQVEKHRSVKGLLFMACCADLRRQFEFVQSQWLQDGSRFGLGRERDPLVGGRREPDGCDPERCETPEQQVSMDCDGRRVRRPMSQFVTTRGGEYFLLPSRPAIRLLGSCPDGPEA